MQIYKISDFTTSPQFAILAQDDTLFNILDENISNRVESVLDFEGIKLLLAPFLNQIVSPLFKKYDMRQINSLISYHNIRATDLDYIRYCCKCYEDYHRNNNEEDNVNVVKNH